MAEQPKKRRGWSWPKETGGPPTRAGRIVGTGLSVMFLCYLATPIDHVFRQPHSWVARVVTVAAVLVYAGFYVAVGLPNTRRPVWLRIVALCVMTVCGVTMAAVLGPDDLVYMSFAIAVALTRFPPMVGLLYALVVITTLLVTTAAVDGKPDMDATATLVVLSIALFGTRQVVMSNAELRAARDEIATLAVAEERARMARDLHDVLGHSLTTITVKAGLARRILESSADGERAIGELRDVEQLSRTALAEVRSTVSGYRKASLPAELVGARVALQAAEITADLPHAVDNVPAGLQEPFAYVLREGVTNVIRHSNARRCEVRLGESWIEVRDDGTTAATSDSGHGLAGLAERLAKVGGSLSAGPSPSGGFVVRATVPVAVTA
ncbi:sensor histidine kinase [Actinophytocola sp.]|uniref:sensor histidine kinase n=1 Tax=Actinophytocola sp. TaxID=1872138 RepID=UPI002ED37963